MNKLLNFEENGIYKIYDGTNKGYQTAIVKCKLIDVIKVLDNLITPDRVLPILVIQRNNNTDSIFYRYDGIYMNYISFKNDIILEQDKILESYYEFIEPSKVYKKELKINDNGTNRKNNI